MAAVARPGIRDDVPPMIRVLLVTLFRLVFAPFWWLRRLMGRPKGRWVRLKVGPDAVEVAVAPPWWTRFVGSVRRPPTNLQRVGDLVRELASDPDREGLLLVIEPLGLGWAAAEALRESLLALRASGKKTVAFLTRGGGAKELYVALACERIVASPPAMLMVPGFGTSSLYAGALLEKFGIRFERFARREFKSAYENLERDSMSEGQRTQVEALLAGFGRALDQSLGSRAGVTRTEIEARGMFDSEWAKSAGLIDAVLYDDELPGYLGLSRPKNADGAGREAFIAAPRYLAYREQRFFPRMPRRAYIAVVPVRGIIGDSGPVGGIDGIVGAIRRAANDPRARAIVLHVDSPGGSALGSDLIHREVVCARQKKPIVASFGNVAASGGYYVAAPANEIVARRLTITGSIGVIAARPSISELLTRFGVVRESVGDAIHASLFDPTGPLAPETRAAFDREIDTSYARFVRVVAEGRKRVDSDIEPLARGRVYLGEHAFELGLVDSLGGFPEAVRRAEALAKAKDPKLGSLEPVVVAPRPGALPPPLDPPVAALIRAFGALAWLGNGPRLAFLEPIALGFDADLGLALESGGAPGLSWLRGVTRSMRQMIFALAIGGLSVAGITGAGGLVGCGPAMTNVRVNPMPEGATFHGVWFSSEYGEMHLCQTNNHVVGEYTKQERHGTVRGTVEGDQLHFEWAETRELIPGRPVETNGHGFFRVHRGDVWNANTGRDEPTGEWTLTGEWGMDEDEVGGGNWVAVMQPRESPDQCYNSIRRTVRPNTPPGDGEIQFSDEGNPPPPPPDEP
jgi:protease-4